MIGRQFVFCLGWSEQEGKNREDAIPKAGKNKPQIASVVEHYRTVEGENEPALSPSLSRTVSINYK